MKLPAVSGGRLRRRIRATGATSYSIGIRPACACGVADSVANEIGEESMGLDDEQGLGAGEDEEDAGALGLDDVWFEDEGTGGFSAESFPGM